MERFTHGIIVVNPNDVDEDDTLPVVHFAGYWEEPTIDDVKHLREELRNNPEFGLTEIVDELKFFPASQEYIDYFNDMVEDDNRLGAIN